MVYYFEDLYVLGVLFLIFIVSVIWNKFIKKKSWMYLLFFGIMYVYLCIVIKMTQFPIYALDEMREAMGGQNVWREMNLIPFKEIIDDVSIDILLNILMTIPLGFGLSFLIRCSWKKIALAGVLVGSVSEVGQLISALWIGFTFRHINIDDVILNFVGVLIGYALFKTFKILFKVLMSRLDLQSNIFLQYINCVCDERQEKIR